MKTIGHIEEATTSTSKGYAGDNRIVSIQVEMWCLLKDQLCRQVTYGPSNTCSPRAARLQDKTKQKLATKAGLWKGKRAQVKASSEWVNRTGSWEDEPPTTGEHLDEALQEVPVALEGKVGPTRNPHPLHKY